MLLNRIDHWIGKTLFVPPIIKFCQWTRQSQFAVSRLFWFVAALDGFYRAETVLGSVLFGGLSLYMMVTASLRADSPTLSFAFFRIVTLIFLVFDIIEGLTGEGWMGVEFWILVLFAEYAATIRTIPPRTTKSVSNGVNAKQS
jgi:hypothetical protein